LAALIGWTRQVPQVWKEIECTGCYKVKEEYIRAKNDTIADYYLKLYEWYTRKSRDYISIPEDAKYPIWFSLSEDFRLQKIQNTVILKVEIPEEEVLVIDMEKWDYRGNLMYVPKDQKDRENFEKELKKYGIVDETALAESAKGNHYPLLKRKIIDSWERLFTMPPESLEKGFATTWELKKEWVKEAEHCES
jgi:hypothetical protein